MPSPFPGMDPFIEGLAWPTFHGRFTFAISDIVVPILRRRCVVQSKQQVYVVHEIIDYIPE